MKNFGTRVLLASMLAIGAQLAGCGDEVTDCPAAVADHTSCSTAGLTCFAGAEQCTCTAGSWGSASGPTWQCPTWPPTT